MHISFASRKQFILLQPPFEYKVLLYNNWSLLYCKNQYFQNFVNQYFNNSKPCTRNWCIGFLDIFDIFDILNIFWHSLTFWDIFSYIQKDLQNTIYFSFTIPKQLFKLLQPMEIPFEGRISKKSLTKRYCTN